MTLQTAAADCKRNPFRGARTGKPLP